MNTFIEEILIQLSNPIIIVLILLIICFCFWYSINGQELKDRNTIYKQQKDDLRKEREELERNKEEFEQIKHSSVVYKMYQEKANRDSMLLAILLLISIIINIYLFNQLREYHEIYGALKNMTDLLKFLLN